MERNNILFNREVLSFLLGTSSIFTFSNTLYANKLPGNFNSTHQIISDNKLPKVVVLNTYGFLSQS
ncbi:hypothetical protein QW060_25980 [Myroides ceti]|uniref:Uncharacterized protein n=1 Tax=Paenimyroides ceti TaxID=395087 RepID=A0ABT8D0F9_9FLAO|nr:hypothetical protein [Paenimyroides ceti]MDN3710284.1 hypothetical protein [Paenimyroides ceti]